MGRVSLWTPQGGDRHLLLSNDCDLGHSAWFRSFFKTVTEHVVAVVTDVYGYRGCNMSRPGCRSERAKTSGRACAPTGSNRSAYGACQLPSAARHSRFRD